MDTEPRLRPAPPLSPGAEHLALARMYLSQGNVLRAKAALKAAIAADPNNDEAIRLLLTADSQAYAFTAPERGALFADLRMKALGLWVIAVLFFCMSGSFAFKAAKAGPKGIITIATKNGGTREVASKIAWSYAAAMFLPAVLAGGFGFYLMRDE